ncbi:hypothetical protein, partial [Pseudomonas aeruginosa]|uniref:hypothetical protein n=1 Tax=Pseudomonas aeruginosa TaxID=287 RepID=UPI00186611B3
MLAGTVTGATIRAVATAMRSAGVDKGGMRRTAGSKGDNSIGKGADVVIAAGMIDDPMKVAVEPVSEKKLRVR